MLRNLAIGAVVGFILAMATVRVLEKQQGATPAAAPPSPVAVGQPLPLPSPVIPKTQLVVPAQGELDQAEHTRRPRGAGTIAPFGDEDAGR